MKSEATSIETCTKPCYKRTGLPFRSHGSFAKADLDARQELYGLLAEHIWNPDNLERVAGSAP
jgi:hypothetical protein